MLRSLWKFVLTSKVLLREDAQDMIEYALLIALLAFAVTVGARAPAVQLNNALTIIANAISSTVT